MKILTKTVSVLALSAMLAACGGGGAEQADDSAAAPADEVIAPAALPAEEEAPAEPDAEPTPEPTETAAPAAEPTPAATSTPAATTAAAAPAASVTATPPPMFAVCAACHAVEPGKHGIGPSLADVFGARAGHASGFEYSKAMLDSGLTWDEATLNRYLENPRQVVPGTTMAYNGLRNETQRKAVVDYLKGL